MHPPRRRRHRPAQRLPLDLSEWEELLTSSDAPDPWYVNWSWYEGLSTDTLALLPERASVWPVDERGPQPGLMALFRGYARAVTELAPSLEMFPYWSARRSPHDGYLPESYVCSLHCRVCSSDHEASLWSWGADPARVRETVERVCAELQELGCEHASLNQEVLSAVAELMLLDPLPLQDESY